MFSRSQPTVQEKISTRMVEKLEQGKKEATWGLFIGDALAMPVHWYYNPDDIQRDYGGWLTGYRAPNRRHPSSILNLSSVGEFMFLAIGVNARVYHKESNGHLGDLIGVVLPR